MRAPLFQREPCWGWREGRCGRSRNVGVGARQAIPYLAIQVISVGAEVHANHSIHSISPIFFCPTVLLDQHCSTFHSPIQYNVITSPAISTNRNNRVNRVIECLPAPSPLQPSPLPLRPTVDIRSDPVGVRQPGRKRHGAFRTQVLDVREGVPN